MSKAWREGEGDVDPDAEVPATGHLWPGKRSGTAGAEDRQPPAYPGKRSLTQHFAPRTTRSPQADARGAAQRKTNDAEVSPADDSGASEPMIEALDEGGEPLPDAATWSRRMKVDHSNTRVVTSKKAEAATESIGAPAFTVGNRVFLGAGVSPASEDIMRHELTHVAQQQGATMPAPDQLTFTSPEHDVEQQARSAETEHGAPTHSAAAVQIAPWGVMGRMGPSKLFGGPRNPQISSYDYFQKFGRSHIYDLFKVLPLATLAMPSPYASWIVGDSHVFATGIVHELVELMGTKPYDLLNQLLAPADLWNLISVGRDEANPDDPVQANQEHQGVTLELQKALRDRLRESIARLIPRVVQEWNRRTLVDQAERAKTAGKDVTESPELNQPGANIVPSHPIDKLVLRTFPGRIHANFQAYRKAFPAEAKPHGERFAVPELRTLKFEWQHSSSAHRWIKVTEPLDATAEEVAKQLFGDSTFARLVTAAPPLFGLNTRLQQFTPAYEKEFATLKVPTTAYSNEQTVLAGPQADDAALNQAAAFEQSKVSPAAANQQFDLLLRHLNGVSASAKRWTSLDDKAIASVIARVESRKQRLADSKTPTGEAETWNAQVREQLDIVQKSERGLKVLTKLSEAFPDSHEAKNLAYDIATHYHAIVGESDLVVSARSKLDAANQSLVTFPTDFMEAMFRWIRRAILASSKNARTGKDEDFVKQLGEREANLRLELVKLRDKLLTSPLQVKDDIEKLFKQLQDLSIGAAAVRNIDAANEMFVAVKESKSKLGWIRSLVSNPLTGNHGNDRLNALAKKADTFHAEWDAILQLWKDGKKDEASKALEAKGKTEEWKTFFNEVAGEIKDQAKYDAWMTFGIMVGVAILTGFIGVLVEPLAVGAFGLIIGFGITVATEAAVFTTLSYFLLEKHPTLDGFAGELRKNLLVFGVLKGITKGWGAMEKLLGVEWKAAEAMTQFAAINGIALYEENHKKVARTGQALTEAEILKISVDNLLFLAAAGIGTKALAPAFGRWQLRGKVGRHLENFEALHQQVNVLAEQVKATKNEATGKELLKQQRELIEAQRLFLDGLVGLTNKGWNAARQAGMTRAQFDAVGAAKGQIAEATKGLGQAETMARLEPVSQGEYLAEPGKFFEEAHAQFAESAQPISGEKGSRSFEVKTPEGNFRVTERAGKPGEVHAGAERIATASGEPAQNLGRSNHDGHDGTYIAEQKVEVGGATHHVRVKRLDTGEYVITICSRCQRIRDLSNGAATYLAELSNNPNRNPHNQPRPSNVQQLIRQIERLGADAKVLEEQSNRLSKDEVQKRTDALAERLVELAADPALEPVLGLGAKLVEPLGVETTRTVGDTMAAPDLAGNALSESWVARAQQTKGDVLPRELATSALEAAKLKDSSPLEALKKANDHLDAEQWGRVEREAGREIVDEYFARLEAGVDALIAEGKKTDPKVAAAKRVKGALASAHARARASLAEPTRYTNAGEFEASLVGLTKENREGVVDPMAAERAKHFGFEPVNTGLQIAKQNRDRKLFTDGKLIYSVDYLHGRFEVHDQRGKHQREINFDGAETAPADKKGEHDLRYGE